MTTGVGALVASLGLDAAEFVSGLTKAEQQAQSFAKNYAKSMQQAQRMNAQFDQKMLRDRHIANRMNEEFDKRSATAKARIAAQAASAAEASAKKTRDRIVGFGAATLGAFGVSFGVSAIVGFTKSIIDASDQLYDLSKRSGVAIEDLAGLGFAFKQDGASAEELATGLKNLNKSISLAGTGDNEKQSLFKALGMEEAAKGAITAKEALLQLADVFPRLNEADRVRVAMELLGKAGESLVPTLSSGAASLRAMSAEGLRLNPNIAEAAKLSNEFNDAVDKIGVAFRGSFLGGINAVLPKLTEYINNLATGQRLGLSFAQSMGFKPDVSGLEKINKEIADLEKGQTGVTGFVNRITGFEKKSQEFIALRKKERDAILQLDKEQRDSALASMRAADRAAQAGTSRQIDLSKVLATKKPALAKTDLDDPTKKILEGQIKELERQMKREKDILDDRAHFLQEHYQDNNVSIRAYFAERKAILDEGVRSDLAAIDGIIAAQKQFQSQPLISQRDHADAENKIADAIDRRAEVQRDAATKGKDLNIEEARATKQFKSAIDQVTLSLMEMRGQTVEAAAFGFDIQTADAKKFNEEMSRSISLAERLAGTAALADNSELKQRIVQQAQLNKATDEYSMTLDKLGIAQARISIAESSGAITGLQALDQKSKANAEYVLILEKQLATLEKIAAASGKPQDLLNVEKMKVELKGLGTQVNLVADEFNKVFKDSFSDAFNSVIDGTSSVKDAFKSMAKDITASLNKIATKELADQLFGKGGANGNGLLSGIGKFLADFFGGSYAGGGMPPIGKLSLVGERGPELFVPKVAGTIVPNDKLGSNVISININVPQNTSRASASQIARETGAAVARATRRDS